MVMLRLPAMTDTNCGAGVAVAAFTGRAGLEGVAGFFAIVASLKKWGSG